MAKTFLASNGDIKAVLRTMLGAPEFWDKSEYRAKVKTPLEFAVSAIRATGADVERTQSITAALNRMGMPLYGAQPPTGYSMRAESWVNSGALLSRMNFALALGTGELAGVRMDAASAVGGASPRRARARRRCCTRWSRRCWQVRCPRRRTRRLRDR